MADLVDLHRAIVAGQSFQVQRAAAKLINGGKHIDLAVEASVAALLNEDKWDEAIIACNARPELQFQKAYALYKKERFAEALAIVAAAEDGATAARWQHLHGQILFRLGRHREAAEQYDAIAAALVALGSDADPIDLADARTNLVATLVASDAPAQAVSHAALAPVIEALRRGKPASPDEPPELYFNLACAFAEAGEPGDGLRAIGTGVEAARATLAADGADAATVAEALAPLLAQAAYILQLCRFDDAAASAYRAVGRPSDPLLAAAVSANAALIGRTPRDVLTAFKTFRTLLGARAVLDRATPVQAAVLRLDAGVLALRCGRAAEPFAAPASDVDPADARGSALAALLRATAAVISAGSAPAPAVGADVTPALATALTELAAASRSSGDVPVAALCVAQLLVASGQLAAAATAIAEATGCCTPAAACAVAALRSSAGDAAGALAALDACVAAQQQRQQAGGQTGGVATALLLRAALRSALSPGADARADLAAVAALPGATSEQRAAALASTALATLQAGTGGPDAAARAAAVAEAGELIRQASALVSPPPPSSSAAAAAAAFDLDALEWPAVEPARRRVSTASTAASAVSSSDAASAAGGAAAPAAAALSAAKLAKKRRALARRARRRVVYLEKLRARGAAGTLFAGAGAAATLPPPDPERWLPRRLRTYGKKSRRRAIGKAAVNVSSGGAQGSAVAESLTASLDAKAKADAAKAAPPAPAPAPAPAPKKGKGRR